MPTTTQPRLASVDCTQPRLWRWRWLAGSEISRSITYPSSELPSSVQSRNWPAKVHISPNYHRLSATRAKAQETDWWPNCCCMYPLQILKLQTTSMRHRRRFRRLYRNTMPRHFDQRRRPRGDCWIEWWSLLLLLLNRFFRQSADTFSSLH